MHTQDKMIDKHKPLKLKIISTRRGARVAESGSLEKLLCVRLPAVHGRPKHGDLYMKPGVAVDNTVVSIDGYTLWIAVKVAEKRQQD